jgi:hypothetical protein
MRFWQLALYFALTLVCTKSSAQELFVFSDTALLKLFAAKDLSCEAIQATPAVEMLSPAVAAGSILSLVILVKDRPSQPFLLQSGQYPAGSFRLRQFRVFPGLDHAEELLEVPTEIRARIPEYQPCALFLLDVEVPAQLQPGRFKLEPAVWIPAQSSNPHWLRYPMEVRVLPASPAGAKEGSGCQRSPTAVKSLLERNLSLEGFGCLDLSTANINARDINFQRQQRAKKQ